MSTSFKNDYSVLAHPRIIEAISRFHNENNEVYGLDYHSDKAKRYIKEIFGVPDAEVVFLTTGTQTNMVFLSSALRHYEGVICADSAHINVHETGAISGSGFSLLLLTNSNGKILPAQVEEAVNKQCDEHMVKPKVVYISNSTEYGTIYKKEELKALYDACKRLGLYLYIDGARLGNALTSAENDIKPQELASLCDAFYVGGAKNGLMIGEALVVINKDLQKDFRYHIKNKGAMLSKGYLIGIEFEEAFKDGLYFELAKHSNEMADLVKQGFKELGIKTLESPTNQLFVSLPKEEALIYINKYGCEKWNEEKEATTIRFVTSFVTTEEEVKELLEFVKDTHK